PGPAFRRRTAAGRARARLRHRSAASPRRRAHGQSRRRDRPPYHRPHVRAARRARNDARPDHPRSYDRRALRTHGSFDRWTDRRWSDGRVADARVISQSLSSRAPLAFRFARRVLRGGLRGFRIFLACLMLGVAAVAAAGSVASSVRGGIAADAQKLLGGDVEVRLLYRPATPEQIAFFNASGAVSAISEMRA